MIAINAHKAFYSTYSLYPVGMLFRLLTASFKKCEQEDNLFGYFDCRNN